MRVLRSEPDQVIGPASNPYLHRWYIIPKNRWLKIYVHKFLRSDEDRALHDHPWSFVSVMLKGSYVEVTDDKRMRRSAPEPLRWFFGDRPVVFRRATWRHRVELLGHGWAQSETPCWTLIITGPHVRNWGFWCPGWPGERFVPWRQWGPGGCES